MNWKSSAQFSVRAFIIAVSIVSLIVALVGWRRLAANDLERLLGGDESISLSRLEIKLQQRRVICTDKAVLCYLTRMMRASDRSGGTGITYRFTFEFSTRRSYQVLGAIPIRAPQFSLSVPSAHPHEGGGSTHGIALNSPIPARVEGIFSFLTASYEEVAGLSLHVTDGQPFRYFYHPYLHDGNPPGTRVEELTGREKASNAKP